ncbi:GNAT family protein [Micromonospora sp. WMMD1102]|uniref:GNAT family N-acetyltransferase n=1 Tax=Micromonospora sp. WMMD1102 TaxID=3016105 RepID=UPI00241568AA|nr:GNAT family protein [Micromonospora sp. WMMD1102]MDG4789778.1 GNAT family protein [Micromonospora sp. WMMD1102]
MTPSVRLRPVREDDLPMLQRFLTEPGLVGLDWTGFRDAQEPVRRFAADGYLGAESSRLIVETGSATGDDGPDPTAAGFVGWQATGYGVAKSWEIGIALLPQWRGQGIGWRAQALLCDYLFTHTPAERIQAGTHPENTAEQRALEKAGFRREGVLRSVEFRAGRWRDGWLYSRLRSDPAPS